MPRVDNLLDADIASNTLSWRWVAGLQTRGKKYIASKNNIDKFTFSRFKNYKLPNIKNVNLADEITASNKLLKNSGYLRS